MLQRFLLLAGLTIFLAGCATTQQGPSAADLQLKVNDLENQLATKDAEIKDLKLTMKDMAYDLDRSKAQRTGGGFKPSMSFKKDDILRVNITPLKLQQSLKAAGYYKGTVDGRLGNGTKAAIVKFQKDHGLKADGIVGEKTWGEIKAAAGN